VQQLDLFAEVEVKEPEKRQAVQLGKRKAFIALNKQRRQATERLKEILSELEGKDIYISSYDAGGRHFQLDNLKLARLKVEYHPPTYYEPAGIPTVIVLWGCKESSVRIFTNYLVDVRTQEYEGYWNYLVDFRNGFWESPIDNFKSHYACLHITKFKD